jgi:hypothetical protein
VKSLRNELRGTSARVNRNRIETFKRTSQYSKANYDLLLRVLAGFRPLYTLPDVLAEVSNLTDLHGPERLQARLVLKETISLLNETEISSAHAAEDPFTKDSDSSMPQLEQ